jgi:23S rRNA pseudouridine2605 synthase
MSNQIEDQMDPTDEADEVGKNGERIAKVLARAGICSRRDAEKMITARRVAVNGTVLTSPACNVGPDDLVTVDGEPLRAPQEVRLWRYHKPGNLVTTHKDPQGRTTVFDVLPRDLPRVVSVGRLDLNSEGLLLLTNDGALAGTLEHPSTAWARRYRVRVHGRVEERKLASLAEGVEVEGVRYGPIEAVLERQQGANCWLQVTLHEGKNREVRRVMEHLGYTVNRLIRVSYGPFVIGRLQKGQVEEVPFKVLREALAGLGDAVPDALRMEKVDTSKWAKAKPRPVRPGHKKIVRPATPGDASKGGSQQARPARTTEARNPRPAKGGASGGPQRGERTERGDKPFGSRPGQGPRSGGPRGEGFRGDGPRSDGPRGNGPRGDGSRGNGPRGDRPQGNGPRGNRPQGGGPRGNGPQGGGPRGNGPRGNGPKGQGGRG